MFTYTDRFTFDWPVRVKLPSGGNDEVHEFTGTFMLPADEMEIFEPRKAEDMAEMVTFARERLSKYWVGWSGIAVENGGDLPFSEANREKLLRQRAIRIAVDQALTEAVLGIREKN